VVYLNRRGTTTQKKEPIKPGYPDPEMIFLESSSPMEAVLNDSS